MASTDRELISDTVDNITAVGWAMALTIASSCLLDMGFPWTAIALMVCDLGFIGLLVGRYQTGRFM